MMVKRKMRLLLLVLAVSLMNLGMFAVSAQQGVKPFRAVWVSTVYNLDYPSNKGMTPEKLKEEADMVLNTSKEIGMTAVFLQVRPVADSFFPSQYFPWSKYLTGTQGIAPADGFDPLAYWVEAAHARGLELHAWINPYRITTGKEAEWASVVDTHPAKQHPQWVMTGSDGNYYFNPGIPEVRQFICDSAAEILNNYNVDGLHLDDYFYPAGFDDSIQYAQYGSGQDLYDWRRSNIDAQVYGLFQMVQSTRPEASFGISPFGIWANKSTNSEGSDTRGNESYTSHFADTRKWVKEGWVDYICPQIYWNIGFAAADYSILANWWAEVVRGTNVKLYVGMADYRIGGANENEVWQDGIRAIREQIELNRMLPEIVGEAHFRYRSIADNSSLKEFYKQVYIWQGTADPGVSLEPLPAEPVGTLRFNKGGHAAYMQGYDGLFRPQASLSRAEASAMLSRLGVDETGNLAYNEQEQSTPNYFSDVTSGLWYAKPISFLAEYKILSGYQNGTFLPQNPISRAEFVTVICRMAGTETAESQKSFSDVEPGYWAAGSIGSAAQKGWIGGYEDGTFQPARAVTRAEAVRIVNRAIERSSQEQARPGDMTFGDVPETYWAYRDILAATNEQ